MITPEQCRAARAWLGWTQEDLAKRARVGLSTIRFFELGQRSPIPNNADAIQRAFEVGGVDLLFTRGGKPFGVGLRIEDEAE